jgi:hypothetical protein
LSEKTPRLRVGIGWIHLEIVTEPYVIMTFSGYAPAVRVKDLKNGLDYEIFISAKTLAQELEKLRGPHGQFIGIKMRIRKESEDKFSSYIVESIA